MKPPSSEIDALRSEIASLMQAAVQAGSDALAESSDNVVVAGERNLLTVQDFGNDMTSLRRLFDGGVLERLGLIALWRSAGFSLDEIARLLAPGRPRFDRRMLASKADELDQKIRELTAMRDGLRHAAACPAPSHMECPSFRRILRAASTGAPKR